MSAALDPISDEHSRCRETARLTCGDAALQQLELPTVAGMAAPFVAAALLLASLAAAGAAPWPWKLAPLLAGAFCYVLLAFVGHDASHGAYSRNRWFNDAVGAWTMSHVFTAFHGFKLLHAAHHRHTGFDEDPTGDAPRHLEAMTLATYGLFVLVPVGFPLFVILPSWLGAFGYQPAVFPAAERIHIRWNIFWVIAYQSAFYAAASYVAGPSGPALAFAAFVLGLWVTTMMNAQAHAGVATRTDCRLCNTRSIETGPVAGLLTAEGGYHVEHHLLPAVPWYRLRRLHEILTRHGGARFVSNGYLDLHRSMIRRYAGLGKSVPASRASSANPAASDAR